jgi:hypothetical protein
MGKDEYLKKIEGLVLDLNQSSTSAHRAAVVKQMKNLDRQYLEGQNISIVGQVMFTRHGQCEPRSRSGKALGLKPNAPLEDVAVEGMANTNKATSVLLLNPNETPRVIVSPLVRTMQTASLLMPVDLKLNVSINPALSEVSTAPSGLDIRSPEESIKVSTKSSLLNRTVLAISGAGFGAKYFDKLTTKKTTAAAILSSRSHDNSTLETPSALDYNGNKVDDIKSIYKNTKEKDLWLIGHGANFKKYFKETFGLKASFGFCETKTVYKTEKEGQEPSFFIPPYSLKVNQKTGELEGNFTGFLKEVKKEVTLKERFTGILDKLRGKNQDSIPDGDLSKPVSVSKPVKFSTDPLRKPDPSSDTSPPSPEASLDEQISIAKKRNSILGKEIKKVKDEILTFEQQITIAIAQKAALNEKNDTPEIMEPQNSEVTPSHDSEGLFRPK